MITFNFSTKTLIKVILGIAIVVGGALLIDSNRKLKQDIKTYDNNIKAISSERDSLNSSLIAYKMDITELEMLNDSVINDLNSLRKELKIKDKQILQMQSIKTETVTKDSIFIKDTIFREEFVKLDTAITNQWYDIHLELEYPSTLKVETLYKSDLSVLAYSSKEILGTPKKCALGRLFQKKYNVIRVEVQDANPYSVVKESKFVIVE